MELCDLPSHEIDELFETFYQNLTEKMHPPQFRYFNNLKYHFWKDRFLNAVFNRKEVSLQLKGYAEHVQVWIAGFKAANHKIDKLRAIILA